MKSIFTLIFTLFLANLLTAQVFTIDEDSLSVTVDVVDDYTASFSYDLIYNDSVVNPYIWTMEWEAPTEWQSQLCVNPVKCYGFDDKSGELNYEPNIDYELALKIYHNDVCGEGVYTLRMKTLAGEVIEVVKSKAIAINCATTPTSETEIVELRPVPNPAKDYFKLDLDKQINKVQIYNQLGQLMQTHQESSSYDISQLKSGIYYLKIIDSNNNNVQTQSLIIN